MDERKSQDVSDSANSSEGTPPPLPVRPNALQLLEKSTASLSLATSSPVRPQLQSKATTSLVLEDVNAQHGVGGTTSGTPQSITVPSSPLGSIATKGASRAGSISGDHTSITSTAAPSYRRGVELESLFDDFLPEQAHITQVNLETHFSREGSGQDRQPLFLIDKGFKTSFLQEFGEVQADSINEGMENL